MDKVGPLERGVASVAGSISQAGGGGGGTGTAGTTAMLSFLRGVEAVDCVLGPRGDVWSFTGQLICAEPSASTAGVIVAVGRASIST